MAVTGRGAAEAHPHHAGLVVAAESHGVELGQVVALLGAGVAAVTVFKRAGLGSVLGYLAAGLAIGPYGLGLFTDPQAILHTAELGVVMFLFVIGLEMQPSRLWKLRAQIFGLGVAQVLACGGMVTGVGVALGMTPVVAFIAAMGFTLSSTAIVMQLLDERGETASSRGQQVVSILLLEDLAIVPLLALVAFLAPGGTEVGSSRLEGVLIGLASILALVAAGRWFLNPFFRLLAAAHAREVMTAAALLVVLGAALLMQLGGLSMAMGAFLAGVLLSESTFRHQLEADIEPFRGILLGLFFLAVGMALDVGVVMRAWPTIVLGVVAFMGAKAATIYVVARLSGSSHADGLHRAALLAQGGEFAFVLYSAAAGVGLFVQETNAVLTTTVIVSMALTPVLVLALRWFEPAEPASLEGVAVPFGLDGCVLMIGFGRFGQVASQSLLARGYNVSIIDTDIDMIRNAAGFGFQVYYGDGTRLDVLHASGAGRARAIAVCVDDQAAANKIVELVQSEFPLAQLLVRAYDREHALHLIQHGIDHYVRETFESAMAFGEKALQVLGVPEDEAAAVADEIRARDAERVELEVAGGLQAGTALVLGNAGKPTPVPLTRPRRAARALSDATARAMGAPDGAEVGSER
ncbi:MAG: monovalent cation:proton antiporter-2 (CPA2) family protein [bacterium]|nr:monovalent cation:proton antiporter-2 (CPA2) family protein [bacterium]